MKKNKSVFERAKTELMSMLFFEMKKVKDVMAVMKELGFKENTVRLAMKDLRVQFWSSKGQETTCTITELTKLVNTLRVRYHLLPLDPPNSKS